MSGLNILKQYYNYISNTPEEQLVKELKEAGIDNYLVKDKDTWNVILDTLEGNQVLPSKNNPNKSGQYVCTCVTKISVVDEKYHRYLRVMEYDVNENYWHDIGNENVLSHTILAWKDEDVCDFKDFKYITGGILVERKD